jgi:peptidoglycan/xylan/chitin deacetylase (PgdA/CDA1 family)
MAELIQHARWRPTPALAASAALHVCAAAALVARPHLWPWPLGAVFADHLFLTAAGLWPRSTLLGPNWTRLPDSAAAAGSVAITIDDGPDPDITPRVLALLDQYSARATFFCIGERVARHAHLAQEILSRGHAIENHSQRHLNRFSILGPGGISAEIGKAQETIAAVTGQRPRFFRAPAGLRSPLLEPILRRLDLQLASWTRRGFDTVDSDERAVLGKLTHQLRAGDILLLHDGHAARTRSGSAVIVEVLPRLLETLAASGLRTMTLREAASS